MRAHFFRESQIAHSNLTLSQNSKRRLMRENLIHLL